MKYIVDKTKGIRVPAERALLKADKVWSCTIPTTPGRHVLFMLADTPDQCYGEYRACGVDLKEQNLMSVRGLCTTVVYPNGKRAEDHSVKVDPYYDVVIGVFRCDTGFFRSPQSVIRTVAHEAAHAARYLAAKDLNIPCLGSPLTREYDEAIAEWTGHLTQKFLDAMGLLKY